MRGGSVPGHWAWAGRRGCGQSTLGGVVAGGRLSISLTSMRGEGLAPEGGRGMARRREGLEYLAQHLLRGRDTSKQDVCGVYVGGRSVRVVWGGVRVRVCVCVCV